MKWLVIAIFCISAPVHAEVPANQKPHVPEAVAPPWELYDTDEDGYISVEEAEAQKMSSQTYNSLDIDRDGRLNKDEFAKAPRIKVK
jgi:Ca2+-binding EF-hand superfamily protein